MLKSPCQTCEVHLNGGQKNNAKCDRCEARQRYADAIENGTNINVPTVKIDTCKEPDCNRPAFATGLCQHHYNINYNLKKKTERDAMSGKTNMKVELDFYGMDQAEMYEKIKKIAVKEFRPVQMQVGYFLNQAINEYEGDSKVSEN